MGNSQTHQRYSWWTGKDNKSWSERSSKEAVHAIYLQGYCHWFVISYACHLISWFKFLKGLDTSGWHLPNETRDPGLTTTYETRLSKYACTCMYPEESERPSVLFIGPCSFNTSKLHRSNRIFISAHMQKLTEKTGWTWIDLKHFWAFVSSNTDPGCTVLNGSSPPPYAWSKHTLQ